MKLVNGLNKIYTLLELQIYLALYIFYDYKEFVVKLI